MVFSDSVHTQVTVEQFIICCKPAPSSNARHPECQAQVRYAMSITAATTIESACCNHYT